MIRDTLIDLRLLWGDVEYWREAGMSKVRPTLKAAIDAIEYLQCIVDSQSQDIHDLRMETSAQAAIIERLKKEVQK